MKKIRAHEDFVAGFDRMNLIGQRAQQLHCVNIQCRRDFFQGVGAD